MKRNTKMIVLFIFLVGILVAYGGLPAIFGTGAAIGASWIQIYHDGMWGSFNHKMGRAWDWRPYWKYGHSKE